MSLFCPEQHHPHRQHREWPERLVPDLLRGHLWLCRGSVHCGDFRHWHLHSDHRFWFSQYPQNPSTSDTVIYTAAKGATLSLLDASSVTGWFRVSSFSGTGWGSSDYLTADGGSGGDYTYPIQATVDIDKHGVGRTLNMRASASSTASVVTIIPDEATIYVQTLSGEWLPAKYNGITGFVMAKFVRGSNEYGGSVGSTIPSYIIIDDECLPNHASFLQIPKNIHFFMLCLFVSANPAS